METNSDLSQAERVVLQEVLEAIRRLRHGSVEVIVQDGKIVQIDTTEKRRFDRPKA